MSRLGGVTHNRRSKGLNRVWSSLYRVWSSLGNIFWGIIVEVEGWGILDVRHEDLEECRRPLYSCNFPGHYKDASAPDAFSASPVVLEVPSTTLRPPVQRVVWRDPRPVHLYRPQFTLPPACLGGRRPVQRAFGCEAQPALAETHKATKLLLSDSP